MKRIDEDEYWRLWEERHLDSKREDAKRRFRAKPYQLEVIEANRSKKDADRTD